MAVIASDDTPQSVAEPHAGPREQAGAAIGRLLAPAIAAVSRLRHARMFHPVGHCFAGTCEPAAGEAEDALAEVGRRLAGRVLARCSAALWKRDFEHLDVLGIALRFRPGGGGGTNGANGANGANGRALDDRPAAGDQDVLFATIRSPLTMLASPLFTNAHDFVANRYWAVSPFEAAGRRFELRLSPIDPPRLAGSRTARLDAAVGAGRAAWWLEARRTLHLRWQRIARVALAHRVELDQEALRFDPFRDGAGLEPVGLVHAIRRAAYAASQAARPRHAGAAG